ncbi:MAG: 1-(5-phosphoribosyl)-5-[(5-phosphoribosylamino)methylideneamino] imidazole-4-carboxamide isomerase [Bryobacteraceae bacterium]|nr:1-(5-phosphoribosyl)-5-[(5-phosphoribosylamino)methylideneamino] imidazole-4-carboxamide isomerase [Bryobacteraceae bacterium]
MIIPCIDLMGGEVVQLVQGRERALTGGTPQEMLDRFAGFGAIQVIDLDAAIGSGSNDALVEFLAARARCRIGGGVRTPERFYKLLDQGADRVIVGTAAFAGNGVNAAFLSQLDPARTVVALDSKHGRIVVKGWRESLDLRATQVVAQLEPYCSGFLCTYVDKEGMLQGTDLNWFAELRAATRHEITAAGGITTLDDIRALAELGIHAALGMAIYTGRLDLDELQGLNLP